MSVDALRRAIASHRTTAALAEPLDPALLAEVAEVLDAVTHARGETLEDAVRAFAAGMEELARQQRFLERHGRYLCPDHATARATVYDTAAMRAVYPDTLLLSQALWPNHTRQLAFFRERFIPRVPPSARVLEVPVGTGWFISELARARPDLTLTGVDLSADILEVARMVCGIRCPRGANVDLSVGDAFALAPSPRPDAIVCGELLEHVDAPDALLRQLREVLAQGGLLFLTTAIWAASPDHVWLFRSAAEVRALVGAHFVIEEDVAFPYDASDSPDAAEVPMTWAGVLRRDNVIQT